MKSSRNLLLAALFVVSAPVLADETSSEVAVNVVDKSGLCSKVCSVVKWPFTKTAAIASASACWFITHGGAEKVANWLATSKEGVEAGKMVSFFQSHKTGTKNAIALVEAAAICAVAYKVYQALTIEEDTQDEYDFDFIEFDEENGQDA